MSKTEIDSFKTDKVIAENRALHATSAELAAHARRQERNMAKGRYAPTPEKDEHRGTHTYPSASDDANAAKYDAALKGSRTPSAPLAMGDELSAAE